MRPARLPDAVELGHLQCQREHALLPLRGVPARRTTVDPELEIVALWAKAGAAAPDVHRARLGERATEQLGVGAASAVQANVEAKPGRGHPLEAGSEGLGNPGGGAFAGSAERRAVLGQERLVGVQLGGARPARRGRAGARAAPSGSAGGGRR